MELLTEDLLAQGYQRLLSYQTLTHLVTQPTYSTWSLPNCGGQRVINDPLSPAQDYSLVCDSDVTRADAA